MNVSVSLSSPCPGHDSSVGEWLYLTVCPLYARVQLPDVAEYFKGFFPGWSHSANLSWASVVENGSISPQWHHTTCGQGGGRLKFNYGQTMGGKKLLRSQDYRWVSSLMHHTESRECGIDPAWAGVVGCQPWSDFPIHFYLAVCVAPRLMTNYHAYIYELYWVSSGGAEQLFISNISAAIFTWLRSLRIKAGGAHLDISW